MSSSNEQCALCKQCDFEALEKRVAALEEAMEGRQRLLQEMNEAFAEVARESEGG